MAGKIKEMTGKKKTLYTIHGKWDSEIYIKPHDSKVLSLISLINTIPTLIGIGHCRKRKLFGILSMRRPRSPWILDPSTSRMNGNREGRKTFPPPIRLWPCSRGFISTILLLPGSGSTFRMP